METAFGKEVKLYGKIKSRASQSNKRNTNTSNSAVQ
jgi:hypothetical protein